MIPLNGWQWMERWEAACILLLLAIPTQHTDITYFIPKWDRYFVSFYAPFYITLHWDCISGKFKIALGAKWSFWVWPVTELRLSMLLSRHNYGLKASQQLTLTNEMQSHTCCLLSDQFNLWTWNLWINQCSANTLIKHAPGEMCSSRNTTDTFLRNTAFSPFFSQVKARLL